MFKKTLVSLALAAGMVAPAQAAISISVGGTLAGPAGVLLDFDSASLGGPVGSVNLGSGFTLTNGYVVTGNAPGNYRTPTGDTTQYLAALGSPGTPATGNGATISTTTALYQSVSFFLGSVDTYNVFEVLGTGGAVLGTFTGSSVMATPDGNSSFRVTLGSTAKDIAGIRFSSTGANATEIDNVVFAVPEPATWLTMILGFGLVGFAMRARRRNSVGAVLA